jgi:hypothetical protein
MDKNLAEQLICHAKSYVLVGDKLYRKGVSSGVLMKCVLREEGKGILEEIHKGVCGNHSSSRVPVSKAFRRAFYWPTSLRSTRLLGSTRASLRTTPSPHHRPGIQLQQSPVLGVLREQWDRRPICLSCPSTGQWTSRACQQDGTRRSQEVTARCC